MNESLVKYLAGLLDADGSLSFTFKRDALRKDRCFVGLSLRLTASDAVDHDRFVENLPKETGIGTVSRYGKQGQFACWCVNKHSELEMLLPRLIKHMYIKPRHWQWLLDMWRNVRAENKTCSDKEREVLTAASKESRRLNTGPVKPKNHPTWAWLAGYLDGDGSYHHRCYKVRKGPYVSDQWSMNVSAVAHVNDICVLEFLQNSFGGRIIGQHQSEAVKVWVRSLGYQNRSFALRFLPHLAKHSRLKRYRIDAMIHHHRQRLSVPGTERTFCSVDGCGQGSHGNGLCSKHYQRQRRADRVQATV